MNNQDNDLPELPDEVYRSIEGKDSGTATTLLAVHRNRLAMRQSGLAELRANLSNENTHLAYLRMAISLVVFGISLNQFSQFMQEQNRVGIGRLLLRNTEFAGAGMVILGIVVSLWSLFRYWTVRRAIRRGHSRPFDVAVASLTLLLVVPAVATVVWIFKQ
jgi:putative membrane protein